MVVNVEQGVSNPSIATLLRLSDALGVGLPALVDVELWDWTLEPGEAQSTEAHAAKTHELLLVLAGQVELTVGQQTQTLPVGDSAPVRRRCRARLRQPRRRRSGRQVLPGGVRAARRRAGRR